MCESYSFRFSVHLLLAIVPLLCKHKERMLWTAHRGLLPQPRRSLTVTRHRGQRALQCFQLPGSDVTLSSGWRNPPEERLSASARLWCGAALWLPWIHYIHCTPLKSATSHRALCGLPKTLHMTFYTWLNIFNQCFQPEACVVKGDGARERDEVEHYAGMMEDDAEKRHVSGVLSHQFG